MHPPMTTAATTTTTTLFPAAHVAPPSVPPPPLTPAFPQHAPPQYASSSQLPLLFPSYPPLQSPVTTGSTTAGLLPSDDTGVPDTWPLSAAVGLPGSPITPAAARRPSSSSSSSPPSCGSVATTTTAAASGHIQHQLARHPSAYLSLTASPHPHQPCVTPVSLSTSANCGTAVPANASYYPAVTEAAQSRQPQPLPPQQQSSHCGNNSAQVQSHCSNTPASIRTVFDTASLPFSSLADRSFLMATPPPPAAAPLQGGRQQRMLPTSTMPMSPLSPSCTTTTTTTTTTGTTMGTSPTGTPFSCSDKTGGMRDLDYTHCRKLATPSMPPPSPQLQQQATNRHYQSPHIQHPAPLSSHPNKAFSTRPTTAAGAAAQREREAALVRRVHVRVGGAGRLSVYERPADVRAAVLHALAQETALDHSGDACESERTRVLQGQLSPLERRVVRTVTNRGAAVRSRMRQRREMVTLRKVVRIRDGRVRQLESIIRALCQAYGVPVPASVREEDKGGGGGEEEEVGEMDEVEDDDEEEEEEEANGDGAVESGRQGLEKTRTASEGVQGSCRKRRRSSKSVGAWNKRARLHGPPAAQAQQQQAW